MMIMYSKVNPQSPSCKSLGLSISLVFLCLLKPCRALHLLDIPHIWGSLLFPSPTPSFSSHNTSPLGLCQPIIGKQKSTPTDELKNESKNKCRYTVGFFFSVVMGKWVPLCQLAVSLKVLLCSQARRKEYVSMKPHGSALPFPSLSALHRANVKTKRTRTHICMHPTCLLSSKYNNSL